MTLSIVTESPVRVNESAGYVKVCVEADHESETSYEVILSTEDGTARGKLY